MALPRRFRNPRKLPVLELQFPLVAFKRNTPVLSPLPDFFGRVVVLFCSFAAVLAYAQERPPSLFVWRR